MLHLHLPPLRRADPQATVSYKKSSLPLITAVAGTAHNIPGVMTRTNLGQFPLIEDFPSGEQNIFMLAVSNHAAPIRLWTSGDPQPCESSKAAGVRSGAGLPAVAWSSYPGNVVIVLESETAPWDVFTGAGSPQRAQNVKSTTAIHDSDSLPGTQCETVTGRGAHVTPTLDLGVHVVRKLLSVHPAGVIESIREKLFAQFGYVGLSDVSQRSLAVLDLADLAPNRLRLIISEEDAAKLYLVTDVIPFLSNEY